MECCREIFVEYSWLYLLSNIDQSRDGGDSRENVIEEGGWRLFRR